MFIETTELSFSFESVSQGCCCLDSWGGGVSPFQHVSCLSSERNSLWKLEKRGLVLAGLIRSDCWGGGGGSCDWMVLQTPILWSLLLWKRFQPRPNSLAKSRPGSHDRHAFCNESFGIILRGERNIPGFALLIVRQLLMAPEK